MARRSLRAAGALLAVSASVGHGQSPRDVPVRHLGPPITVSTAVFKAVAQLRAFADGRVLVNDLAGRAVVILDAALASPRTLFDSAGGDGGSYGRGMLQMVPFVADSTLVIEGISSVIRVIDANGNVGRMIRLPVRPQMSGVGVVGEYTRYLTQPWDYGSPGVDAQRRLIFRRPATRSFRFAGSTAVYSPVPDSAFLLAMNLETLAVERVTSFRIPLPFFQLPPADSGRAPPLLFPRVDDWAVTADGSIALVRGYDYHVEWLRPDGSRRATAPPLQHAWERLTTADKIRKADSLTKWRDSMTRANVAALQPGLQAQFDSYGGYETSRSCCSPIPPAPFRAVPPAAWPDTMPAFPPHGVRADADGNLWIEKLASGVRRSETIPELRQPTESQPGAVYDVVNGDGRLADRIQLPAGRWLVGFGRGGVLYLVVRQGDGVRLERYRRP